MKKVYAVTFTLLSVAALNVNAQNIAINTTGVAANASALLDISATNKGILIPQVALTATNAAGPITSPATGLLVYNTATAGVFPTNVTPGYYYWSSAQWERFGTNPQPAWYTAGNAGTTPTNNFLGTTDNQPMVFRSNNVERGRLTPVGELIIGGSAPVLAGDLFIATSLSAGYEWPVNGYAYLDGGGVYGRIMAGNVTNYSAVQGEYDGTGTTPFGAAGVYGVILPTALNRASHYGVLGINSITSGTAVVGASGASLFTLSTGSGGAFTGDRYGSYNRQADATSAGTGYSSGSTYTGSRGNAPVNTGVSGDYYHFGMHGIYDNSAGLGYGRRSGGTLGYALGGSTGLIVGYGCLGYNNSAATPTMYGLLYVATAGATTAGKYAGGNDIHSAIGMGGYGDLMGGWVRGNIYGMNIKGNRYTLYLDGKTYTNDVFAQLNSNGTNQRIVSYVPTSTSVDVYAKGTATLSNGKAFVKFDRNYSDMVSLEVPVIVTVTPMGKSNGVYIESVNTEGFTVVENNNGTSDVQFSWIAIGTKRGFENPSNPDELLSPYYDEKMNGVMFNEGDLSNHANTILWDGTQLHIDDIERPKTPALKGIEEDVKIGTAEGHSKPITNPH